MMGRSTPKMQSRVAATLGLGIVVGPLLPSTPGFRR
jgi:hypothetical protein